MQLDEMHSKLRGRRVEWLHTALAMGSLFLLWVHCGPRTQESAALLIAQVVARLRTLPLWLTDGWKAYRAAFLQVLGRVYHRRAGGVPMGVIQNPSSWPPADLFYAQVVKVREATGTLVQVLQRVIFGGPRRFFHQLKELHNPPFSLSLSKADQAMIRRAHHERNESIYGLHYLCKAQ